MVRFAFKRGLRFIQNTKTFTLLKRLANGNFQLEDEAGQINNLSESEMHARWATNQWQIDEQSLSGHTNVFYFSTPKDLRTLGEEDQKSVKRRISYLEGIRRLFSSTGSRFVSCPNKLAPKIAQIADELNDPSPPTPSTIWRWKGRFDPTKCVTKLQDHKGQGAKVDALQKSLFDEAVAEVFLTPQKMPGSAVFDAVCTKVKRINNSRPEGQHICAPSRPTIYRWLSKLHHQVVQNARAGKVATDKELRSAIGQLKIERILERVELDHTPLDAMIICKVTRMVLGRPWVTLAIDRHSRMIMGFYISFHTPSATSVLQCIREIILPKERILARFPNVEGPWPARGIPDELFLDNGMELHALAVEAVCLEIGTGLGYCGVALPQMKGAVERVIGTLNRNLIHTLPGTTFSNFLQKGDYDSEAHACIDLELLTEIIVKWIADVYHKTPHRGMRGRTPLAVWQEGEQSRIIELPAFPRQLDNIVGNEDSRTLWHYGLQYDNLLYHSPLLHSLVLPTGGRPNLKLRAFEHDVGFISVFHPELKEFIEVPAVDIDYANGVNRHVHTLVCAEARRRHGDKWTMDELRTIKAEIQALVDQAIRGKKKADRKKAAVHMLTDSASVIDGPGVEAFTRAQKRHNPAPKPAPRMESGENDVLPQFGKSKRLTMEAA